MKILCIYLLLINYFFMFSFLQKFNNLLKKPFIIEIVIFKNIFFSRDLHILLLFLKEIGLLIYFVFDIKNKELKMQFNLFSTFLSLKQIQLVKKTVYFSLSKKIFKKSNILFFDLTNVIFLINQKKNYISSSQQRVYLMFFF